MNRSIVNTIWKLAGIALLIYVFCMVFLTPLGPGLLDSDKSESGEYIGITLKGFNTHFTEDRDNIRVFIKSSLKGKLIEAYETDVISDNTLDAFFILPDTLPSNSWTVLINSKTDGTLPLVNALFHKTAHLGIPVDYEFAKISESDLYKREEKFQFPFQPNIIESIRNLMLHVPMWFTMFFLMGIGVVNSALSLGGNEKRVIQDDRAVSAIRVGLLFGVLGLITGSLWARFTWGAWWVNDPQLNGAMVTVLIYSGYLILRFTVTSEEQRIKISSVYSIFAFVILVILLMVLPRFNESLHPGKGGNPAFSKYDLDNSLRFAFYPAVIGWILLGSWLYTISLRTRRLKAKVQKLKEY